MCVHIAYQEAFDQYVRHVALMAPLDCYVPKHHIVFHLLADVGRKGNPRFCYAKWLDEALNQTLKGAGKYASQRTFECSVLFGMWDLLADGRGAKRGR